MSFFTRVFKCQIYTKTDWYFLKARSKLAKELDIQRLIKNIIKMKIQMKFLTTHTERRLAGMQASNKIIVMKKDDKIKLTKPLNKMTLRDLQDLDSNSSVFIALITSLGSQKSIKILK